jgi:ABC-type enterobactin transport system permease subunit
MQHCGNIWGERSLYYPEAIVFTSTDFNHALPRTLIETLILTSLHSFSRQLTYLQMKRKAVRLFGIELHKNIQPLFPLFLVVEIPHRFQIWVL